MDRLTVTCKGTIADLRHSRPQTAGTTPGTKLTLDTEALDPDIAAKLFALENGHPVQITIEEIQDRLPLEPLGPDPSEGEDKDVPKAFRSGWSPPETPAENPATRTV